MTEHAGPEQMRSAMAEYVQAVHGAYIDAANALPPGDRARLPLFAADTFTVIVAGARYLHVLATTDKLRPGGEIVLPGWASGEAWHLWESAPKDVDVEAQPFEAVGLEGLDGVATEVGLMLPGDLRSAPLRAI